MEKCVQRIPISVQCAIAFRKKMVIGNHGFYTKEKWMHYAILITHQSDTKICTANFQTCVNDKSHYSHSNRSSFSQHVCAMRRSLITFRFLKPAKFPSALLPATASNTVQLTTMYDCTKSNAVCRNGSELGFNVCPFCENWTWKKKSYLNHGGVNLKNRGKVKVGISFSPHRWWGTIANDVKRKRRVGWGCDKNRFLCSENISRFSKVSVVDSAAECQTSIASRMFHQTFHLTHNRFDIAAKRRSCPCLFCLSRTVNRKRFVARKHAAIVTRKVISNKGTRGRVARVTEVELNNSRSYEMTCQ
jgi:hypothetical protein